MAAAAGGPVAEAEPLSVIATVVLTARAVAGARLTVTWPA
jgi:hypothetical protein